MTSLNNRLTAREEPGQAASNGQRSLALPVTLERLHDERKHTILDLGPSLSHNLRFLAEYRCKVYVEHFAEAIESLALEEASEETHEAAGSDPSVANYLQRYSDETRFDIVFAWDLFDYLPIAGLRALIRHLRPYCTRDTRLLALVSTAKQIPASPTRFHVLDNQTLRYEVTTQARRAGPMHSQMALRKQLPGLDVLKTYLLRNGIQEYIFRFGQP